MDAVYILGSGSLANNEELRYSVRSLAKNMLDLGNVFVVGHKPDFLPGALEILAEDISKAPWKNAQLKTLAACSSDEVSDDFLLMNDDFFLLTPFSGAEWPYFAQKGGSGGISGRENFGIHCPIQIKKSLYPAMPLSPAMKGDYSPRSFYANYYRVPVDYARDCILRPGEGMPGFDDQLKGSDFFSIDDVSMLDPDFAIWLAEKYPEPSRFE